MTMLLKLCVAGAADDTGNRGVDALYTALVAGLDAVPDVCRISVFDNGWGVRPVGGTHGRYRVEHCGVRLSRRWYRPESWHNIGLSARFGGLGNPVANRLLEADAVLDISGGDSFSDIYGERRFRATMAPKRAAMALRRPLVLLPQTYGPFATEDARSEARAVVRNSTLAYSRDDASHDVLLDLLGTHADSHRNRRGVDVAFALQPVEPRGTLPPALHADLAEFPTARPRVGLNVSGLLYNDPRATQRFGLSVDYRSLVGRIVSWFVDQDCDVFLVPHVVAGKGSDPREHDDDLRACRHVVSAADPPVARRLRVVPGDLSAAEIKWVIARMDWFCGTRMHSTIAALSSGVPTAALAYSMKTAGVFEKCGQGTEVIEARTVVDDECLARVKDAWCRRESVREELGEQVGAMRELADRQLAEMMDVVRERLPR